VVGCSLVGVTILCSVSHLKLFERDQLFFVYATDVSCAQNLVYILGLLIYLVYSLLTIVLHSLNIVMEIIRIYLGIEILFWFKTELKTSVRINLNMGKIISCAGI